MIFKAIILNVLAFLPHVKPNCLCKVNERILERSKIDWQEILRSLVAKHTFLSTTDIPRISTEEQKLVEWWNDRLSSNGVTPKRRPRKLRTADWVLFSNTCLTFFGWTVLKQCSICLNVYYLSTGRTNSTSDRWFNITCLIDFLWEILFTGPKYSTKIKQKNKFPYILGANCGNFWQVCGFLSFSHFVVVVVLWLVSVFRFS